MTGVLRNMIESGALRRIAVAASVLVHVGFLAWLLYGGQVKLFDPSRPAAIAVELVSPDELERKKAYEPPPPPAPADTQSLDPLPPPPPPAGPSSTDQPSQQADQSPPATPTQPQTSQSPPPSETPTEPPQQQQQQEQALATFGAPVTKPDVTAEYGTLFQPFDPGGYDVVKDKAKLDPQIIAAFRKHLKSCSVRPAGLAPTGDVHVVIRVAMHRDGTLAAPPALVEAKASAQGPLLMKAAIKALQDCQPYTMLPVDKYNEWKVLDLDFSQADFPQG